MISCNLDMNKVPGLFLLTDFEAHVSKIVIECCSYFITFVKQYSINVISLAVENLLLSLFITIFYFFPRVIPCSFSNLLKKYKFSATLNIFINLFLYLLYFKVTSSDLF